MAEYATVLDIWDLNVYACILFVCLCWSMVIGLTDLQTTLCLVIGYNCTSLIS